MGFKDWVEERIGQSVDVAWAERTPLTAADAEAPWKASGATSS